MRRSIFISLLTVIVLVTVLLALPAAATSPGGSCGANTAWSYDPATTTLTISGKGSIDGEKIHGWDSYSNEMTTIVIGEGVTAIGNNLFSGYPKLATVSLPSSLKTIGENVFSSCFLLKSIDLKNAVTIRSYAFSNTGLEKVTIPSGTKTISYGAFSFCNNLASITIPSTVTTIDAYAFSNCNKLVSLTVPDSVTKIGSSAFSNCYLLSNVTLSNSLTHLGDSAFSGCENLKSIRLPDQLRSLEAHIFSKCTSLSEVIIGKGVDTIKDYAFLSCPNLRAFTLSSENTHLKVVDGILYNKSQTELILIPSGLTGTCTVAPGTLQIRGWAAYSAQSLTELICPDSLTFIGRSAFGNCQKLSKVTFGNSLQTIDHDAFYDTAIKEITFPASLQRIGLGAFRVCKQLKYITFTGSGPIIEERAFSQVDAVATTYSCSKGNWDRILDEYGVYNNFGGHLHWTSTDYVEVKQPGREATCSVSGLTEGIVCGTCSRVLARQGEIPKLSHFFRKGKQLDEQIHKFTCSTCGHEETGKHDITSKTTQKPTCTQEGITLYYCFDCDYERPESIPVVENNHVYDHGCDTDCNQCGKTRNTTHVFSKEWACDSTNHWRTCVVCSFAETASAHTAGDPPTATTAQTCTVCKYILAEALGTEPEKPTEPAETPQPHDGEFPWWIPALVGGLAVCAVLFVLIRKKKTPTQQDA